METGSSCNLSSRVFSVEVESVALVCYDTRRMVMTVKRWGGKEGLRELRRKYP